MYVHVFEQNFETEFINIRDPVIVAIDIVSRNIDNSFSFCLDTLQEVQ